MILGNLRPLGSKGLMPHGRRYHLRLLNRAVIDIGMHSFLGNIIDLLLVAVFGDIFSDMLYLLIIRIKLLNRFILNLRLRLIFFYSFGNRDVLDYRLRHILRHLFFNGNLFIDSVRFVVNILSFNRNMFHIGMGLGDCILNDGRLGSNRTM